MPDFFTTLIELSLGRLPLVQPLITPLTANYSIAGRQGGLAHSLSRPTHRSWEGLTVSKPTTLPLAPPISQPEHRQILSPLIDPEEVDSAIPLISISQLKPVSQEALSNESSHSRIPLPDPLQKDISTASTLLGEPASSSPLSHSSIYPLTPMPSSQLAKAEQEPISLSLIARETPSDSPFSSTPSPHELPFNSTLPSPNGGNLVKTTQSPDSTPPIPYPLPPASASFQRSSSHSTATIPSADKSQEAAIPAHSGPVSSTIDHPIQMNPTPNLSAVPPDRSTLLVQAIPTLPTSNPPIPSQPVVSRFHAEQSPNEGDQPQLATKSLASVQPLPSQHVSKSPREPMEFTGNRSQAARTSVPSIQKHSAQISSRFLVENSNPPNTQFQAAPTTATSDQPPASQLAPHSTTGSVEIAATPPRDATDSIESVRLVQIHTNNQPQTDRSDTIRLLPRIGVDSLTPDQHLPEQPISFLSAPLSQLNPPPDSVPSPGTSASDYTISSQPAGPIVLPHTGMNDESHNQAASASHFRSTNLTVSTPDPFSQIKANSNQNSTPLREDSSAPSSLSPLPASTIPSTLVPHSLSSSTPTPTLRLTIGRLEIHASHPNTASMRRSKASWSALSLDAYLQRNNEGKK